ncbi:hypothetical protein UNSW3_1663 [Campylobacter concisus UNSW3]|uniref:Uncharacterized protein n=1 Tax=Campylobacter concisus UNSW3 TaxID=1242966 RepID=U2EVX7_9BACT|nr:hypothetical protein UNSW3_1663 [Campylobacter concisus UNSW3]
MPFSIKFKASHKSLRPHLKFDANLYPFSQKQSSTLNLNATHKIKFKLYF